MQTVYVCDIGVTQGWLAAAAPSVCDIGVTGSGSTICTCTPHLFKSLVEAQQLWRLFSLRHTLWRPHSLNTN
jgi:hypothetical protein